MNFMLRELVKRKEGLEAAMAELREQLAEVDESINIEIAGPVAQARQLSGKDTGTVDVLVDGVRVKHLIPKRVVWDQEKMLDTWNMIKDAGDDPLNYMTVKTTHTVKEKLYDSFPDPVRAIFAEAREVRAGKPKITFE
jgi:hypothetical protein